jgi:hypothetical protein
MHIATGHLPSELGSAPTPTTLAGYLNDHGFLIIIPVKQALLQISPAFRL